VSKNASSEKVATGRASGVKFCGNYKLEMAVMQALNIVDCFVEPHLLLFLPEGEDNFWQTELAMLV